MSETAHAEEELLRRGLHELAEADCSAEASSQPALLMARGRRTLRRRRMATLTASLALLGVVGAGGVYGGVFDTGKGEGGGLAAEKGDTARPTAILRGLLPEGKVSEEQNQKRGSSYAPYLGGSLVFDDGKGAGVISIALDRLDSPFWQTVSLAGCTGGKPGVGTWGPRGTCTQKTLADGSSLLLTQAYEAPYRDQDPKEWSARLITSDGSMLTVREWNAPRQKGAAPSRETPPLTQQQLTDVVTSKVWQDALASLPQHGNGVADPDAPSGKEIWGVLEPLLPATVKHRQFWGGGTSPTDFLRLDVDDGKGWGALEIIVDHRGKNDSDRVRLTKLDGPDPWSDKGRLRSSVTAVRPGGFRVIATCYNATPAWGVPSRSVPPLTIEQLQAIAADDAWDEFR
ncbi:hypothetical protein [Streptomyces sp. NPDC017435]|uniref:hypothetical protein n=1 Tax=Streptomyces sp. NPDC017435 TaxID=3364995 RepID=UPI0037ABF846